MKNYFKNGYSVFLLALAFATVIKRFEGILPKRVHSFFDENYDIILAMCYIYWAIDVYKR